MPEKLQNEYVVALIWNEASLISDEQQRQVLDMLQSEFEARGISFHVDFKILEISITYPVVQSFAAVFLVFDDEHPNKDLLHIVSTRSVDENLNNLFGIFGGTSHSGNLPERLVEISARNHFASRSWLHSGRSSRDPVTDLKVTWWHSESDSEISDRVHSAVTDSLRITDQPTDRRYIRFHRRPEGSSIIQIRRPIEPPDFPDEHDDDSPPLKPTVPKKPKKPDK